MMYGKEVLRSFHRVRCRLYRMLLDITRTAAHDGRTWKRYQEMRRNVSASLQKYAANCTEGKRWCLGHLKYNMGTGAQSAEPGMLGVSLLLQDGCSETCLNPVKAKGIQADAWRAFLTPGLYLGKRYKECWCARAGFVSYQLWTGKDKLEKRLLLPCIEVTFYSSGSVG